MTLRPCQHFWPINNPKTQGIHPIWANHPGLSPSVRLGPLPGDLEVPSKNQSILGASGFVYDFWSEKVQHGFFPGWFLGFYLSGWYPKKSIVFKTCCVDWWVDLLILFGCFWIEAGTPTLSRRTSNASIASAFSARSQHSDGGAVSGTRSQRSQRSHRSGDGGAVSRATSTATRRTSRASLGSGATCFFKVQTSGCEGFSVFGFCWPLFTKNPSAGKCRSFLLPHPFCPVESIGLGGRKPWWKRQAHSDGEGRVLRVWVVWSSVLWAVRKHKETIHGWINMWSCDTLFYMNNIKLKPLKVEKQ